MLKRRRAPEPAVTPDPPPPVHGPWPEESYEGAAAEVVELFAAEGVDLKGSRMADIGCGDGVMDLGLFQLAHPAALTGFDIFPVDTATLLSRAMAQGVAAELPEGLGFSQCGPEHLHAPDHSFDYIFSWSAFEHVVRPVRVLQEVHRILTPEGMLMIQLWPFYHSKHGSHLWDWFPDGFAQLLYDPFEVERRVRAEPEKGPGWTDQLLEAFRELNRITVDDLHRALMAARFRVVRAQLLSETFHIPPELAHLPLTTLAVTGVKLLAVPE